MDKQSQQYNIIYADPPWEYGDFSSRGVENKYSTMKIDDICNLNVENIAKVDCVLFLWATFPKLPEALKVVAAWGFEYKTCAFNWVKRNKENNGYFWGMGKWTRANSEICLLATRGKPTRISADIHSVIDSRIREHSEKPNITRNKIVELMGDLPRIELFARGDREKDLFGYNALNGWDVWGNEIESDIEL